MRVARERGFFERAAGRGLGGRVGHQRVLQAQHRFGDPGAAARGEFGGAEFFAVVQTVAERVAAGAAVVFGFEAVGVEGAGVGLGVGAGVGAGFVGALVRGRGAGGGGGTALDGVVAGAVVASGKKSISMRTAWKY